MSFPVPVHGNYHGYYSKRPSIKDPRVALLPSTLLKGSRVLDVGCNEGWVTCEIAQTWGATEVIGVDIDDTLIRGAWRRRRAVWSAQAPDDVAMEREEEVEQEPPARKRVKLEREVSPPCPDYFPASCEHSFGPLPIRNVNHNNGNDHPRVFPHNVSFRTADWTESAIPEDAAGYDVVIAFSISKWIHLNGGDAALERFFRRAYGVLKTGGTFVLEPQAWDTYGKAKRMDERLRENSKTLKLRPDDFEQTLARIGFGPAGHLGTIGEGGFRRPVDLYVKL